MASTNVLVHINMNGNEIQNVLAQKLAAAPSSPSAGQFYYNTTDNTLYVYNGSQWLNALAQGTTYSEGAGIDITSNTISIDNTVTGATKCKITYNNQGLVTSGADLSASDIPNLSLSKITDVTATTAEINVLDGITATTSELNILDGVTVSASDINSVTSKIELTDLSIDSGSTNYLGYDNSTGKFSAKVDTTVTASSTNLVTSGAVESAIASAVTGGMVYKGVWTATGQTDYSSITLPVKAGYMYLVSGSATIGGIEWNTDDYLVINADVAVGGTITDVKKIDNTEGSDIVRLNASQTLTNKTIDADDNTISDLTTSNLKSGVLQTTVRATTSATDTTLPSELAVATALSGKQATLTAGKGINSTSLASNTLAIDSSVATVYTTTNPALTASGGVCIWSVTHNIGSTVGISVYDTTSGEEVICSKAKTSSSVATVKLNSASNISAGAYSVVVQGA